MPNDVSAFITPVRDLNDEPCALVKVEAPSDFAFSTPLGIVSRKDKVGEIWLYLPKGSKLLTIKHPEWGVLRDYRFSKPLESRMTYELKLKLPKPTPIIQEKHDTIVEVKTVIDTIAIPQVGHSAFQRFAEPVIEEHAPFRMLDGEQVFACCPTT